MLEKVLLVELKRMTKRMNYIQINKYRSIATLLQNVKVYESRSTISMTIYSVLVGYCLTFSM